MLPIRRYHQVPSTPKLFGNERRMPLQQRPRRLVSLMTVVMATITLVGLFSTSVLLSASVEQTESNDVLRPETADHQASDTVLISLGKTNPDNPSFVETTASPILDTAAPSTPESAATSIPDTTLHSVSTQYQQYTGHRSNSSECMAGADYGVISGLLESPKTFCSPADFTKKPGKFQTTYTHYRGGKGNIQATVFRGLLLDLSKAQVTHDISSIAEDGGAHDPRYKFSSVRPLCQCSDGKPQDKDSGAPRVWADKLTGDEFLRSTKPTDGEQKNSDKTYRVCEPIGSRDRPNFGISEAVQVLLIARFNDHNPFFQLSQTLNTWIMMKVLDWSNMDTQIVYLDKGIPSHVDELRHRLLAPLRPAYLAADLMTQKSDPDAHVGIVEFNTALVAPYEWIGPMMRHLNDEEDCEGSQLIKDFRLEALTAMGVRDRKTKKSSRCLLTIISRRDYSGRQLQRTWLNEKEVLEQMMAGFGDQCSMQSVDFVDIPMAEQMRTIVSSDIVIGMHGAGMANVMWTRPGTLVIEIFPKDRRRWGFRNICQHVGCEWLDFRGGDDFLPNGKPADNKSDSNTFDKSIPVDEWVEFANPLLTAAIARATANN